MILPHPDSYTRCQTPEGPFQSTLPVPPACHSRWNGAEKQKATINMGKPHMLMEAYSHLHASRQCRACHTINTGSDRPHMLTRVKTSHTKCVWFKHLHASRQCRACHTINTGSDRSTTHAQTCETSHTKCVWFKPHILCLAKLCRPHCPTHTSADANRTRRRVVCASHSTATRHDTCCLKRTTRPVAQHPQTADADHPLLHLHSILAGTQQYCVVLGCCASATQCNSSAHAPPIHSRNTIQQSIRHSDVDTGRQGCTRWSMQQA